MIANILQFTGGETAAEANMRAYIERAKKLSVFPNIIWDNPTWELDDDDPSVQQRAHKPNPKRLHFTTIESVKSRVGTTPLPQPFQDFAKAMLRRRASQRQQVVNLHQRFISGCRFLEKALRDETGGADPARLIRLHFERAQVAISKALQESTAYRVAGVIEAISDIIDQHRLTETRIGYRSTLKRPRVGDGLDDESQEAGLKKMPSRAALDALADASNNPLDDNERLLLRHIDLLAATGFRIGEALTLPLDCWVEEGKMDSAGRAVKDPVTGQPVVRFGIRYWPEKNGDPIVRWLPTDAVDLARRAITQIEELCRPARNAAAWLEQHPGRLEPFAAFPPDSLLTTGEADHLLGWQPGSLYAGARTKLIPEGPEGDSRALRYRIADIEKLFVARRFDRALLTRGTKAQMLSQSLSVGFVQQFHSAKATLPFLVAPITLQQIQDALGAGEQRAASHSGKSIFEKRGLTEKGKAVRIVTHAFRHWLNTLANDGGISDVELARWMGRKDLRQNEAYKHGTVKQRVTAAKEALLAGGLKGPVADIAFSLPEADRVNFLDAAVEAVHFTPLGACVHNFAASPCKYHLNCLRGCGDYLREKGNQAQRKVLVKVRDETQVALEKAKEGLDAGEYGASNWVAHQEATLAGAIKALAVDDDLATPDGEKQPVFPGNQSLNEQR